MRPTFLPQDRHVWSLIGLLLIHSQCGQAFQPYSLTGGNQRRDWSLISNSQQQQRPDRTTLYADNQNPFDFLFNKNKNKGQSGRPQARRSTNSNRSRNQNSGNNDNNNPLNNLFGRIKNSGGNNNSPFFPTDNRNRNINRNSNNNNNNNNFNEPPRDPLRNPQQRVYPADARRSEDIIIDPIPIDSERRVVGNSPIRDPPRRNRPPQQQRQRQQRQRPANNQFELQNNNQRRSNPRAERARSPFDNVSRGPEMRQSPNERNFDGLRSANLFGGGNNNNNNNRNSNYPPPRPQRGPFPQDRDMINSPGPAGSQRGPTDPRIGSARGNPIPSSRPRRTRNETPRYNYPPRPRQSTRNEQREQYPSTYRRRDREQELQLNNANPFRASNNARPSPYARQPVAVRQPPVPRPQPARPQNNQRQSNRNYGRGGGFQMDSARNEKRDSPFFSSFWDRMGQAFQPKESQRVERPRPDIPVPSKASNLVARSSRADPSVIETDRPREPPIPVDNASLSKIQGDSLKTWAFTTANIERVHVMCMTEGRPLSADIDLWNGPDNAPVQISLYSQNGLERPFSAVIETPGGDNALAIRNTATMEFPLTACVEAEEGIRNADIGYGQPVAPVSDAARELAESVTPREIQGGAVYSKTYDDFVSSVQVMLSSNGRPMQARIELIQGPNNDKQVIQVFSQNGAERPVFFILESPGVGNLLRVVNTAPVEYPVNIFTAPYSYGTDPLPSTGRSGGNGALFVVD